MTAKPVAMSEWGKDHWSTLAYLETCVVDNHGYLDNRRLRGADERYPTRLREGTLADHSDYDCLSDFVAAGLALPAEGATEKGRVAFHEYEKRAKKIGTAQARGETLRFTLTDEGIKVCAALRAHKARGGNFAEFRYPAGE